MSGPVVSVTHCESALSTTHSTNFGKLGSLKQALKIGCPTLCTMHSTNSVGDSIPLHTRMSSTISAALAKLHHEERVKNHKLKNFIVVVVVQKTQRGITVIVSKCFVAISRKTYSVEFLGELYFV